MSQTDTTEVDVQALEQEGEIAADYIEACWTSVTTTVTSTWTSKASARWSPSSVPHWTSWSASAARSWRRCRLTRLAVHRQTGNRTRLMLDVGGYRERRRAELTKLGTDVADEVQQ